MFNQKRLAAALLTFIFAFFTLFSTVAHAAVFYVVTNKSDNNTVMAYHSDASGKFSALGEYATGGTGTGDLEIPALKKDPNHPLANGDDPLISANAIAQTADGKFMVVVNPGDGTISLMSVEADNSLKSVNSVTASDKFPISVAIHGNTVVAASVGLDNMNGSIASFMIKDGKLVSLENSRRDLKARPSTISFSTDGNRVIVDELVTGKIKVYGIKDGALSDAPVAMIDSPRDDAARFQAIPVGFAVKKSGDKDVLLVSEARFLTPDFKLREAKGVVPQSPLYSWQTGSVSTYTLAGDNTLSYMTKDALTGAGPEGGEIANCWVALSKDGNTLYAANALSSSISTFAVAADGSVKLSDAVAFKDKSETLFFSDMTVSVDGKQLYQLVGNKGEVMIFNIEENGKLTLAQTVGGMPALGTYGLVAR